MEINSWEHIEQAATDAVSFVYGLDKADFLSDKGSQNAVVMSLVIIGEAASKIMDQHAAFVDAHSEIPWQSARGMRNRIVHGCFEINLDMMSEAGRVTSGLRVRERPHNRTLKCV